MLYVTILKGSAMRYLLVGGSSFLLDAGLLFLLYEQFDLPLALATSVAFWVAVIYNFVLTKYWTFSNREKDQLKKHIVLYLCLLGFNYLATVWLMILLTSILHVVLAKTLIAAAQTLWNYPIYKYFIFKRD